MLNTQASSKRASKYMKQNQIELQGEIDKLTITVGSLNSPLQIFDRTSRQKII